jgi:hypothetical protein
MSELMKNLWVVFFVLASTPALASQINCVSYKSVTGWVGTPTNDNIRLSGMLKSDSEITGARVSGAYESDKADLKADPKFIPKYPQYENMNRFSALEDAWCWFRPLLPKNISKLSTYKSFQAFLQVVCEEGRNAHTYLLSCSLR